MSTTNMGLIVPGVGTTLGPQYASDINADLAIIDTHDHASGNGVPITPDGMNISSDLSIGSNNLTAIRGVRMNSQNAALALAADVRMVYSVAGDLYYNNSSGTAVQITSGGSVAGSSGTITGLPSGTAGAAFGAGKFVFTSATLTSAPIDGGSYLMRNASASSYAMTLAPPASMASDRTITFPNLPSTASKMVMASSGTITLTDMSPQVSSSCGAFSLGSSTATFVPVTNLSVTITTSGRPVYLALQSDGTTAISGIGFANGTLSGNLMISIFEGSTEISRDYIGITSQSGGPLQIPTGSIHFIRVVAAGTYTYTVKMQQTAVCSASVSYAKLVAYEL